MEIDRSVAISYGPREKSEMHWHPAHLAIALTAGEFRMHLPDGTSEDLAVEAGQVIEAPSGDHRPENLRDQPFEAIAVELKGRE